jgi:hypothetical protein
MHVWWGSARPHLVGLFFELFPGDLGALWLKIYGQTLRKRDEKRDLAMNLTATPPSSGRDLGFIGGFALLKLLLHLPVLTRYGYHHDEFYFLACGRHLSFGYVDHPPIVPSIARLADSLFGQSLFGLRIFATLAGAAVVFLTGLMARRLGGGRFAQATACLAVIVAPVFLRTDNMFCIPAFEQPLWILGSYLLVRIVQEDKPRLWLWFGATAGIGLMVKHSMLFFGFGVVAALILTEQRKQFKSWWLYAGGGLAALIFLPNLIWQALSGWPTVVFLRHLNEGTMSGISVVQFVAGQVLYLSPFTAPVWIGGLVFFFSSSGKRYRFLGWIYVSIFVLLVILKSKIYYLAPAYPALLAGGGVALEQLIARRAWPRLRPLTLGTLSTGGLLLLPLALPVFSIGATERYITAMTFGAFRNVYELTGDLHGMFGWRERVAIIAGVYNRLPTAEKERTVILAGWYGPAAAVDYLGGSFGLPKAVSGHMTYWLWGLPAGPIDTVLAVYIPRGSLLKYFDEVTVGAQADLDNVNPNERRFGVLICRKPKADIHTLWPEIRRW